MVCALAVWKAPYLGSFALPNKMVQALWAFEILAIFVSIVLSTSTMGISSMACAGAGVSLQLIATSFPTTGICGSRSVAGMEEGEIPGTKHVSSICRKARTLAVPHLLRMSFQSVLYLKVEGSLGSSSNLISGYDIISLGRAPNNISTCEYKAKAPWVIGMRLTVS